MTNHTAMLVTLGSSSVRTDVSFVSLSYLLFSQTYWHERILCWLTVGQSWIYWAVDTFVNNVNVFPRKQMFWGWRFGKCTGILYISKFFSKFYFCDLQKRSVCCYCSCCFIAHTVQHSYRYNYCLLTENKASIRHLTKFLPHL